MVKPKDELDMSETIAEARKSIKSIEGTTARISNIVNDNVDPHVTAKRLNTHMFTLQFVSFVLVCIIAVLGLFGVMFFQITQTQSSELTQIQARVIKLESAVREIKPLSPGSGK